MIICDFTILLILGITNYFIDYLSQYIRFLFLLILLSPNFIKKNQRPFITSKFRFIPKFDVIMIFLKNKINSAIASRNNKSNNYLCSMSKETRNNILVYPSIN